MKTRVCAIDDQDFEKIKILSEQRRSSNASTIRFLIAKALENDNIRN